MARKRLPSAIEALVLTACRRRCCVCFGLKRDDSEKKGQIAHLDHDPSNNELDNLAYLCLEHHDQYDSTTSQSKNLTLTEIKHYRSELGEQLRAQPLQQAQSMPQPPKPASYDPIFPNEVKAAVRRFLPDYRLPVRGDLYGDWGEHFDHKTGSPLVCQGDFTGKGITEYAFFVIREAEARSDEISHKMVLLTEKSSGEPELIEIRSGTGYPQNCFLETVEPGKYSVSPVIWKHGGPKTFHLPRQAVMLGTYESSAGIFYWSPEEQRFLEQWLSD